MKKYTRNTLQLLFWLFFLFYFSHLPGQSLNSGNDSLKIRSFRERLSIITDRDIYITGENVWVKVYKLNGLSGTLSSLSKVVYLELLDNTNNPVSQVRIWTPGTFGSTGFRLSDTLSSGNYQIRAYTKWMTNYSEEQFFYKTITLINPFKNIERLINPLGIPANEKGSLSQTEFQPLKMAVDKGPGNQIKIKAETGKSEYGIREKAEIKIIVTDAAGNPVESEISLSVVKPFLLYRQNVNQENDDDTLKYLSNGVPVNLPEIEGPILSGVIRSTKTNEPLKNIDLSLSTVGKSARCLFVKTNERGAFNFVLREQPGISDLVIQPLAEDFTESYVELNQPFWTTFYGKKPESFYLDSITIAGLNNAVIGMQVNNIYEPFRQQLHSVSQNKTFRDFYGEPDRRILMSDYIELKDIREVVKEILPEINVTRRNKKYGFKIINSYPYPPFENRALILVDGVPVYDIENLLKVSSRDLERIDIINRRYYFSDLIFDGILSFTTRKGDMSALESDKFVYRQVFEGYNSNNFFYLPDYGTDSLKTSHIPDFRNTLFWKPDLKSNKEGKASVEFFTSDESGEYTIILEAITTAGKKGYYSFPLKVK